MIHQHIFASPRPGMSEQEFQDYWRYEHAINYAVPIPQVRKYKIDCKIDIASTYHPLAYAGLAEIWLNNDQEQAESVLTPVQHCSMNWQLNARISRNTNYSSY